MVKHNVKGKICFVSSFLGYMSIIGYSPYSPGKFALRGNDSEMFIHVRLCSNSILLSGLAETLQSEFVLYGIDIHICFPGTIFTPGYEEENRTKPKITLKIEETDGGMSPEGVAAGLLKGVLKVRCIGMAS